MESLYKIKSMDTGFHNTVVAHKLTKKNNGRSVKLWQRRQKQKQIRSWGTTSTESVRINRTSWPDAYGESEKNKQF